ncbi:MAG: 1-deoxy-D-xylulose-5-phosphate reductoisomerase, partial [Kiritimatiellae bacterium]|nr:1-deoxy-D-xylulose-5-phosphate reductoisomerase [Kiritimatiellia bacterium]
GAAVRARALLAGSGAAVFGGQEAVCELAALPDADLVVCAMTGMAALAPVLAAIDAGHDVAIATKEVFVAAGAAVMARARERGVALLPIDSEHSAIFQALSCGGKVPACVRPRVAASPAARPCAAAEENVEKLWLTASGGPFAFRPDVDFDRVSPEQALAHPRWKMGPKVTVDSATMMNKGLEIMEASRLFAVPPPRIGVLVHPESVVHSLVEFRDGAQLAQLGAPDMRIPIQYAMTWPDRAANPALPRLSLAAARELHFSEPDPDRFPALRLAREAMEAGGLAPCVLNAADEAAVAAFLAGKLPFSGIWRAVGRALENVPAASDPEAPSLAEILETDAETRRSVSALCGMA